MSNDDERISGRFREQAARALRALLEGLAVAPHEPGAIAAGAVGADEIHAALVAALMRILLVLFAEARGVSPAARDASGSLSDLRAGLREVGRGDAADDRRGAWRSIMRRCQGLGAPVAQWLADARIGDEFVLLALDSLLERNGAALDYAALDVEHLGSAYEGVVELAVDCVDGRLALVPGGRRRRAGSYYTPRVLTREVVARTLGPLLEREPGPTPEEILSLRVCDPAMGSGAFLIEACRVLGDHLAAALRRAGMATGGMDDGVRARRLVAVQCLRGVDVDPLAVELARMSLWLLVGPEEPLSSFLEGNLRCGDSVVGAGPAEIGAFPVAAFRRGAGSPAARAALRAFRRRWGGEQRRSGVIPASPGALCRALDAWTALWFWPLSEEALENAPTPSTLADYLEAACRDEAGDARIEIARSIARERRFLCWQAAFPDVFEGERPGFDAIVGNPPWVAFAGRASQPIEADVYNYFVHSCPAFQGYRSLHGVFVHRAASLLREGGRLGLVLPTSVADLDGYAPVRRAHDALCAADMDLPDFGADAFEGVFQPCMALLSTARPSEARDRSPADGGAAVWSLARSDLDAAGRRLLERLARLPTLPASLFGERGFQSMSRDAHHIRRIPQPDPPYTCPIREGTDIVEFIARPPRHHIDTSAVAGRFRAEDAWRAVQLLVRQTARYPIVALSDGLPFRNSLLAGFAGHGWTTPALLCYLNAWPVRWYHYMRNRDARQGMPQVKIAHLRALPAPEAAQRALIEELDAIGRALDLADGALAAGDRARIEETVARMLELTDEERRLIAAWAAENPPPRSPRI